MNRKYFTYLLKEHKIAFIFFGILFLGISMTPFIDSTDTLHYGLPSSLSFSFAMAVMLTYALPMLCLAFVHRKRSVDLYFSLPVKRSEQIITILLFCFCITAIYYLGTGLFQIIVAHGIALGATLKTLLFGLFAIAVMIIFNSLLFLIGNNLFDGVVLTGAYTVLPFVVFLTLSEFASNMMAGYNGNLPLIENSYVLLSPLTMLIRNFSTLVNSFSEHNSINPLYIILPLLYALASCYGLKKEFVERKSERAEQLSDDIAAYPAVINIYAFLILLTLAAYTVSDGIRSVLFFYLLLLFIFVVAMFIYRRKIKFELRSVMGYMVSLAITLALAFASWNTHFFGLADRHETGKRNYTAYSYTASVLYEDLGKTADPASLTDKENGNQTCAYVNFDLPVPNNKIAEYQGAIEIMDRQITKAIESYYKDHNKYSYASISLGDKLYPDQWDQDDVTYFYRTAAAFTEEELLQLSEYCPVSVEYIKGEDWINCTLEEFIKEREND